MFMNSPTLHKQRRELRLSKPVLELSDNINRTTYSAQKWSTSFLTLAAGRVTSSGSFHAFIWSLA